MKICKNCFNDEELRAELDTNGVVGECEICKCEGKVLDFSEFYNFFKTVLSLYTPQKTSNKTIVDIIQEEWHIFKDRTTARTLLNHIINLFDCGYSIDSCIDYTNYIQNRISVWDRLKASVKEDSRFFSDVEEFLKYNYITTGRSLYPGQKLFRSRITPIGEKKISPKYMGCPPKELATAGRANPIGIPYLYLSDSAKTTYFEVRAVYLDRLSVGTFRIERKLELVDFIYDINLFLAYNDGIAPLQETVIKKKVIDLISQDLSKPLRRYDSELEYVPTQLICEYCKRIIGADGISFESSLHKGGRNYVLFDSSAAKCTRVDVHEITKIDIDTE